MIVQGWVLSEEQLHTQKIDDDKKTSKKASRSGLNDLENQSILDKIEGDNRQW